MKTIITNNHTYFPQPESQGGVYFLNGKTEIKNRTSINLDKLNEGYDSNRCYVVPSKDMVVVRVGAGPNQWNEQLLISSILDAINKQLICHY